MKTILAIELGLMIGMIIAFFIINIHIDKQDRKSSIEFINSLADYQSKIDIFRPTKLPIETLLENKPWDTSNKDFQD